METSQPLATLIPQATVRRDFVVLVIASMHRKGHRAYCKMDMAAVKQASSRLNRQRRAAGRYSTSAFGWVA